jgi:phosphoheptose isomerase
LIGKKMPPSHQRIHRQHLLTIATTNHQGGIVTNTKDYALTMPSTRENVFIN